MHADENWLNELSRQVIGCAFTVLNGLGAGFLERVYENALAHELRKAGLAVEQQHGITVTYDGIVVGEYVVDLMVEQALVVELKAAEALDRAHHAQCINYLKAADRRLGLLLNFGNPRLEIRRVANGLSTPPSACFAASPVLSALGPCSAPAFAGVPLIGETTVARRHRSGRWSSQRKLVRAY